MDEIGNETRPVYVDEKGVPQPCAKDLTDISVENKGTNKVIAIVHIDDKSYEIRNRQISGLAFVVKFWDEVTDTQIGDTLPVLAGGSVDIPAVPDHTGSGYDFTKWEGGKVSGSQIVDIHSDLIVIARYQLRSYTVTFRMLKDGAYTTLKTETVTWGQNATAPGLSDYPGYTRSNWDKAFTNVRSDLTVTVTYGLVTHTVRFFRHRGETSPAATQTVTHGYPATDPGLTLKGWTLNNWYGSISFGDPITEDVDYYGTWTRLYRNLYFNAASNDPDGNTDPAKHYCIHSFFLLDTTDTVALPAGAEINVSEMWGLIRHDGSASGHHLLIAPCFMADGNLNRSSSTAVTFELQSVDNDTFEKIVDEDYVIADQTVNLNPKWKIGKDKNYASWTAAGHDFAPRQSYSAFGWDGSGSITDWYPRQWVYDRTNRNTSSGLSIFQRLTNTDYMKLGAAIDTEKVSAANSVKTFEYDTSSHDVTVYKIPAKADNGNPINKLCIDLVKMTNGCSVKWQFLTYQLELYLT